jgi:GDP-D-mannose dehydratase
VAEAFSYAGIPLVWEGSGVREYAVDARSGKVVIAVDEKFFRPTEVDYLLGDATKAKTILGWEPKTKFTELVKIMVEAELKLSLHTSTPQNKSGQTCCWSMSEYKQIKNRENNSVLK